MPPALQRLRVVQSEVLDVEHRQRLRLEHVGMPDYPTLGRVIDRSLTDRGRGLLHFIGRNQAAPLNPWIRKRIFPGAYAPTLREVFEHVLEPQALSVLDVENLRLHSSVFA